MNKVILLIFFLAFGTAVLPAQTPSQSEVRQELDERGVNEAMLRQRLLAAGIDPDNPAPEDLPRIQAIIAEMEAAALDNRRLVATPVDTIAPPAETPVPAPAPDSSKLLSESNIYGHQIFRNKGLGVFATGGATSVPESYPLKSGDEIAISIFGASQTDFLLRLDEAGFVRLPNGLRIPLGGVSLGEARNLLGNRLRQYYTFREGQLSIRMQVARAVSVNVFGEVENNGTYEMSSLNSAFNALVAAGGPTEKGTVRKIQLIDGERTETLDVYAFLQSPLRTTEQFLSENATVFVPPAERIVTLDGGVNRPLRYEMLDGEGLAQLIEFAGGTLPRAETSDVRVTRYEAGRLRVIDVDLTAQPDFALVDGDEVFVPIVERPVEDFVSVEGEVLLPGRYAFTEAMTVDDLLTKGRLRPGARRDVAFLFRSNDDGTSRLIKLDMGADAGTNVTQKLQRGDVLRVLSQASFVDQNDFTVEGAVRDTLVTIPFPTDGSLLLEEAILLAGGLRTNAAPEVMIVRTPLENQREKEYLRLDLRDSGNTLIQPLDRIIVYDRERFSDDRTIAVAGAVRQPGEFVYDPTLSLRDLLYLAGGLRLDADRDRIDVFRLNVNESNATKTLLRTISLDETLDSKREDFNLQAFDEVVVRSAAEYEMIRRVFIRGEVRYPGLYALLNDNEKLSDLIRRAGGLTPEAFPAGATLNRPEQNIGLVVLDLDRVLENPTDPSNMVLKRADTLYVPKRQDLVTIYTTGTLADRFGQDSITADGTIEVAYQGPRSAEWYVEKYAGGFNNDIARRRWTTVEFANGGVEETSGFLGINNFPEVRPGSKIRVGMKPPKPPKPPREPTSWGEVAQATLAGITSLVTLLVLVDRLNQ